MAIDQNGREPSLTCFVPMGRALGWDEVGWDGRCWGSMKSWAERRLFRGNAVVIMCIHERSGGRGMRRERGSMKQSLKLTILLPLFHL